MTFSSKSNEFELPQVGETWLEVGKQRLWLVVNDKSHCFCVLRPHAHGDLCERQVRLLQLETGDERHVNVHCLSSKKHRWKTVRLVREEG